MSASLLFSFNGIALKTSCHIYSLTYNFSPLTFETFYGGSFRIYCCFALFSQN